MQQTVNLVQILPTEPAEDEKRGQETEENGEHEVNNSFKASTNININTYQPTAPLTFYQRFKSLISSTIGENQPLIIRLFGVYKGQTAILIAYDKGDLENIAISALHVAVMSTKNRRIHNLPGFFNGIISRMLDRYIRDVIQQESVPLTEPLQVW
ncbi:hypothetical protein RRU94_15360 [Domibacillus sp. DTU_2020_1001157_1_SI_ALB_TIR_016]|uniref:hypothetical protein n=1 Tax=Domibacillus sp. DTU_2020_1001157_1_SI_ALB_TIR_016 TaxID=3077789 RepID=UPI0028E2B943|nr:hypothetical protein [Domibacillus sp. DTU_2020_1001157_1_SI_ALB_TIR_016]WNS82130.1 hypothetical protein RRU94_15360 [Domibacillus sp. DTU_2020_1001157_1_SI_ALB_TIR_016]